MKIDRYKTHTIHLIIDRIKVSQTNLNRLKKAILEALKKGKGELGIFDKKVKK